MYKRQTLFYLCITIYLYGDLAIYGAAVAKSLRDVACTFKPKPNASSFNISDSEICWEGNKDVTRLDAYRIALALFVGVVGPFAFCNVTKTKYLQMLTTFHAMGSIRVHGGAGHHSAEQGVKMNFITFFFFFNWGHNTKSEEKIEIRAIRL